MSTNGDVIAALEANKAVLQGRVGAADIASSNKLMTAIHNISDEVGALQTKNLANSAYVPATNPFKQATADAQAFVKTLTDLKSAFATIGAVAGAVDQIIKLITTLGL